MAAEGPANRAGFQSALLSGSDAVCGPVDEPGAAQQGQGGADGLSLRAASARRAFRFTGCGGAGARTGRPRSGDRLSAGPSRC